MEISDAPLHYQLIFGAGMLGAFGLLAMIGFPASWQNPQGWLLVSYIGIPGFLIVIALLVNMPAMLFGLLFLLGIWAAGK